MHLAGHIERYADDQADVLTDEIITVYKQAAKEVKEKLDSFLAGSKARDAQMKAKLSTGEITKAEYKNWLSGQVFIGKQWQQKLDDVTKVYVNADKKARELVGGTSRNVFVEAANYTAYDIEKGTNGAVAFNLYDQSTVERLLEENPQMLPEWKIDEPKDYTWNAKRVKNSVLQGIIQGESAAEVGKRLFTELAASNANKMDMFARTAITGAQNAGRMARLQETQEMGIEVKKKWLATLDGRTRDSHRDLDGQETEIDKPFKSELGDIMYPGDPTADAANVYNCRCALTYIYPKYQQSAQKNDRYVQETGETISYKTYNEWKTSKQPNANEKTVDVSAHHVAQGTDITQTWARRADQFDFAIEDIMSAQRFDGLPKIVDTDEFDRAVKESGIFCKRIYSAENPDVALEYQRQLYSGKWHVDCSEGGAAFGQGMYCACSDTDNETKAVAASMVNYAESENNIVETITLAKGSKTIKFSDLDGEFSKLSDEDKRKFGNIGVYAVAKGYDAILECGRKKYAVILNRTACIIREGARLQSFEEVRNHWMNFGG